MFKTTAVGNTSLRNSLVEKFATSSSVTKARHFNILQWKLVVISQFLPTADVTQSKNDDMQSSINNNLSWVAVGLAWMVDKPGNVTTLCSINDIVVTAPEHVTANAMRIILPLSDVSHRCTDHLSSIFHQHLPCAHVVYTEQSETVDLWTMDSHCCTTEFTQMTKPHCHWQITQLQPSVKAHILPVDKSQLLNDKGWQLKGCVLILHGKPIVELLSITCQGCHIGSHTQHRWTWTPARQASTRFTYPRGIKGWVDIGVHYTGWANKNRTCLSVDNSTMVTRRKACDVSKVSECCRQKGPNLRSKSFKYSLTNLPKSSLPLKLDICLHFHVPEFTELKNSLPKSPDLNSVD